MAGAGVGVLLPVVSVEPRPFVEQPAEAAGEVWPEPIDLATAHLIDDHDHHELGRLRGRGEPWSVVSALMLASNAAQINRRFMRSLISK